MHQAKPSGISASAGFSPSDEEVAEAITWFRRTSNLRETAGVDSLKLCRTLTSGAMAITYEVAGLNKIHIIGPDMRPPPPPPPEFDGIAKFTIPMWYCGHAPGSAADEGAGLPVILTETTRRRMVGYDDEKGLPAATQILHEFVVEYGRRVNEFAPRLPAPGKVHTHFGNQHPTWYTGGMPAALQIARGFGKQRFTVAGKEYKAKTLTIPEKVVVKARKELGVNTRLPGYNGVPPENGVLEYDYKFLNTDTVGFDRQSRPWLVKVSSGAAFPAGVWAMPLPMIPMTTTQAFREWVDEKGDSEILAALDKFGGLPSGEDWPRDFHGWRRAGVIIKVCDTADYFSHTPYTTPCGFAFNSRATEGFATCSEHVEGGINLGHSYKIKLSLVPSDNHGLLPTEFHQDSEEDQRKLNGILSSLYRKVKEDESFQNGLRDKNALFYKVRRAGVEKVFSLKDNLEAWVDLELDPIASHHGSVARVGTGNLVSWTGGVLNGILPEAKLPEAIAGDVGVWSLSGFTDRRDEAEGTKYPECDTVIYGYYDDKDQLKTLKYYRAADKDKKEDKGEEPPDCMLVGDFAWKGPATDKYVLGTVYTSDEDDRREVGENYTSYKMHGEFLYTSPWVVIGSGSMFDGYVKAFRHHYYSYDYSEVTYERHFLNTGVAVPYGQRSGYVYHTQEADRTASSVREKDWTGPIGDAASYEYHYNAISVWWNPETDSPKRVIFIAAHPNGQPPECATEASAGNWAPSTDEVKGVIDSSTGGWEGRWWGYGGMTSTRAIFPPKWHGTRETKLGELENEKSKTLFYDGQIKRGLGDTPIPNYLTVSPDENGVAFALWGVKNAAGDSQHAFISEGMNHYGRSSLVRDKQVPRFFGVINE